MSIVYSFTFVVSCVIVQCAADAVIVESPDGKVKIMEHLLSVVTAHSRLECAEMCYNSSDCSGSLLRGHSCHMYANTSCICPPNTAKIVPDSEACYGVFEAPADYPQADTIAACEAKNMKPVEINNELENDMIKQMVTEYGKQDLEFLVLCKLNIK